MIIFEDYDATEIRKKSEFAYMAARDLAMAGNLCKFCDKVEGVAKIEWNPSLVKVYFDTVCVDIYINEFNGAVESISYFN